MATQNGIFERLKQEATATSYSPPPKASTPLVQKGHESQQQANDLELNHFRMMEEMVLTQAQGLRRMMEAGVPVDAVAHLFSERIENHFVSLGKMTDAAKGILIEQLEALEREVRTESEIKEKRLRFDAEMDAKEKMLEAELRLKQLAAPPPPPALPEPIRVPTDEYEAMRIWYRSRKGKELEQADMFDQMGTSITWPGSRDRAEWLQRREEQARRDRGW